MSSKYISKIVVKNTDNKIFDLNLKGTKYEKLLKNKNLIPDLKHSLLSFNIHNTKSSFVNALRRCILDELLVKVLYFDLVDIKTNDEFILNDLIQERIQLISINQDINDDITFSLNVFNNTNKIISIYSESIKPNNNTNIYFNQNIKLCDLKPNKHITINNIHIKSNYGHYDNIYSIGRASYEVINFDMTNIQSLSSDPSDFKFYIYSNGNIEPTEILKKTLVELTNRLTNILNLINTYNPDETNDELIINKEDNITIYFIKNEYHTLGNLLVDYMYELDNSTNLLNYKLDHPSKNEINIKTDNPNANNLITTAINNIIIDLNNIKKIFNLN